MRTVENLMKMDGRVFVYLRGNETKRRFLTDAESEGFMFRNWVKPADGPCSNLYVLNDDRTLNYPGCIGHMAFHNPKSWRGKTMIRIDYEKYVSGQDDYMMEY